MVAKIEPLLTIEDLDALPEDGNRYELIEGELFVSRAPTLSHQAIVRKLLVAIQEYLEKHPIGEIWPGPGVIFSDFSGVIPDLVYISKERSKEIASGDSSRRRSRPYHRGFLARRRERTRDRKPNRQLYQKYGVKEYWLIDPHQRTVEIYRTRSFKLAAKLGLKDEIASPLLLGFRRAVREVL